MRNLWRDRRARAVHLLGRTPHAAEILTFYAGLTDAQESVASQMASRLAERRVADLLALVRSGAGEFPLLHVEKLPLDELRLPFRDFLSCFAELGTETIKNGARALLSQDDDRRLEPLRAALRDWRKADSTGGAADHPGVSFYARAFLEPVVTSIAQADRTRSPSSTQPPVPSRPADWNRNFCWVCGGAPQVAVLQDLPDAVGRRGLACSMCATEWRFQRLTCLHCGEIEADKLPVHTSDSIAHVRVDACATCSRYIKTVDLRKDGTAVPPVDELAAVELDLWAREQGLTKFRVNVLGL